MSEADRFSLEALRHIHKQLDDDNDGGIEVNESVEVSFGGGPDGIICTFNFTEQLKLASILKYILKKSLLGV